MRIHITILLLLILSSGISTGQEKIFLTKEEALSKIKEKNLQIRLAEEEALKARAAYRQTNSVFLPSVTASHTGFLTTNPLMAFGSKLNQEILTPADFDPAALNDPEETRNFATVIEVQQPLINVDGFYQRRAAKLGMEAMELQTLRSTDHILLETEKAYMQLQLAYKAESVLQKALEAARENERLARNSFEQGLLQRADLLAVEVRVNEVTSQLQNARNTIKNASNYLAFLMNEPAEGIYQPKDSLTITGMENANSFLPEHRADIKALEMATHAREMMSKADKLAFLPRLNAFGNYQLYDNEVFQGSAQGYLVGASLTWDIFKGYQNVGKAEQSKAEYEHSKLELEQYVSQSEMELNQAKRALEVAESRLDLSAKALEQSEESLRIRTNRFREGLERTTDLLMAETQYAQKQLEYYQTIYEFNYAQAYLQFLTKE